MHIDRFQQNLQKYNSNYDKQNIYHASVPTRFKMFQGLLKKLFLEISFRSISKLKTQLARSWKLRERIFSIDI